MNAFIIAIQTYRYANLKRKHQVNGLIIKDIDNIINSYASPLKEWDEYKKQLTRILKKNIYVYLIMFMSCSLLIISIGSLYVTIMHKFSTMSTIFDLVKNILLFLYCFLGIVVTIPMILGFTIILYDTIPSMYLNYKK